MAENRLDDEEGRVAALNRYQLLDGRVEPSFPQTAKLVQMALDVPIVAISMIGRDRQVFLAVEGMTGGDMDRTDTLDAFALMSDGPMVIFDTWSDPRLMSSPQVRSNPHIRSYLGTPLVSPDGYNVGVISVMDVQPRHFDGREVAMLAEFARLVMDQIEMRQADKIDPLTGALSRRGFYHEVEREFARARRYARPSSLLFLDIDHFHKINDAFGHSAGDEALKAVAGKCIEVSRQTDYFGRIGGQEFGFLLPETSAHEAMLCAERMREVIERMRFRTESGVLFVTASFGVASISAAIVTAAQWFAETDVALYQAKRDGRNCSVLATHPALSESSEKGRGTIEAAAATIVH
jgi:diguanylate cyclase (GGDEF)-like protein